MKSSAPSEIRARGFRLAFAAAACLALCAAQAVLLSGCATMRPRAGRELLPMLGQGASVYAVIPVKANRPLAEAILAKAGEKSSLATLDRLDSICVALYADGSSRAVVSGNIPKAAASLAFAKADGWVSHDDPSRGRWYTRGNLGGSIPERGMVFIADSDGIESMLDGRANPAPIALSQSFDSWLASPASASSIGVYVADFASFGSKLLGPELEIPVDHAEVFLDRPESSGAESGQSYSVSMHVALKDPRAARGLSAMVRIAALSWGNQPEVRVDGSDVFVSGFSIDTERLAAMAEFLYLGKKE